MKVLRKVGDRGQVTIPKEIREVMEIDDGDIVEFEIVAIHHPKAQPAKKTPPAQPQRRPDHEGVSA